VPTLPRTPTTSAGGLCVTGGADEATQIRSLTERVAKLEQALQYMLGEDISASQLSDISQNAGWVTGITYMGTPGWTRTAAGTLIPPAGFSLSGSGLFSMYDFCTGAQKDYQGVVMDEDRVLQFGFTPLGEMCGEKVQAWDTAATNATPDYGFKALNGGTETRNVSFGAIDSSVSSGGLTVTVTNGGIWHVEGSVFYENSGTFNQAIGRRINFNVKNLTNPTTQIVNGVDADAIPQSTAVSGPVKIGGSLGADWLLADGDQVRLSYTITTLTGSGTESIEELALSVVRIGD
jgi:hypothetical protein